MPRLINKRRILRDTLAFSGGLRVLEAVSPWSGLLVLNYHRIGRPGDSLLDHALWSASVEDFDKHVRLLKKSSDIIGLDQLPAAIVDLQQSSHAGSRNSSSKNRFSMITFDDGYLDNFELAFPVLKSHGVPGVFFIATGFLDTGQLAWWDEIAWMVRSSRRVMTRLPSEWELPALPLDKAQCASSIQKLLRCYYELDGSRTVAFLDDVAEATGSGRAPADASVGLWMNWDNVREMRREKMSIGAHTVNHPVLSTLPFDEQNAEVAESRLRIEQELGEFVTALSYPVGSRQAFNTDTRTALQNSDFDWAFSYYGGFLNRSAVGASEPFDRLDIPRVAIESDTSLNEVRSICSLPQIFARH